MRIGPVRARRPRAKFPVSDGAPVEVVEDRPSLLGGSFHWRAGLTMRPALAVGSYVPAPAVAVGNCRRRVPRSAPATGHRAGHHRVAERGRQLVRAAGVLPADGKRRIVLYMHGGAFLTCGVNSHSRLTTTLSKFADAPVLVVNYRLIPKHTIGMAVDDCHDAYRWLRLRGYEPDQIVLAGDSAGGYLALTLAQRLQAEGEEPAALVALSPLLQLAKEPKQAHPNMKTDAMFPPKAFDALVGLVARAAAKRIVDGEPERIYEPLDHIEPGLPRTLIHVSGSEVLLHDARLAARRLAAAGVPTEVRVWRGQIHDFQLAAPIIPEATRSLRQIGEYIREATG